MGLGSIQQEEPIFVKDVPLAQLVVIRQENQWNVCLGNMLVQDLLAAVLVLLATIVLLRVFPLSTLAQ